MKLEKLAGATSEIWQIFIQDKTSTVGAGLAGLVFNTASLTAYYHRDTDTTATAIALVTMTVGTFTSSGFKEIDATNMPGWYQFCPPNAALATGAKSCGFHLKGGGNMADLPIEVQLVAYNPDNATNLGLTNLSLPLTAAQIATGVWQDATGADFTAASSIGKSLYTSGAVPGAAGGLFIAGANAATTVNFTGTISTVTNLTNLPAIPANWLTAAGINAGALNGKGDWLLASSYTAPLSAAATATAVWTDNVAGDFTIGATIGKSIMNGVGLGTGLTVANLTTLPSIPANWLTAAGINAGALNGKGDWLLAASYTAPLSAAATATAVWQDTTAGDFTLGASIGKSIMNGVALGTGLTVNDLTTKTGFSLTANGLNGVLMSDLGAPPAANASVVSGLSWIFMAVQNDRKTTSTQDTIANSAGAVVGTATVSDDTVTYEKTKYA